MKALTCPRLPSMRSPRGSICIATRGLGGYAAIEKPQPSSPPEVILQATLLLPQQYDVAWCYGCTPAGHHLLVRAMPRQMVVHLRGVDRPVTPLRAGGEP